VQATPLCQEAYSWVFPILAIWAVENDLIPKQAFGEFPVPEESAASVKAQRTFTPHLLQL
jgi:hypothetical protein